MICSGPEDLCNLKICEFITNRKREIFTKGDSFLRVGNYSSSEEENYLIRE
jgi:hypothetical protein